MRTIAGAVRIVLATVMAQSNGPTTEEPIPWLDQSGLAALLAGSLVVLITFFTSYSHVDIPSHASIRVNQQIGIPFLLAALAALVGAVQLASKARCADQRARIQARLAAAQCRFLLADSPRNRLQLSETLALLQEDLGFSGFR
jgi:hypothetical protein